MDSAHIWDDAEECHSSESGWTMYIDSPPQALNHHGEDDEEDEDDDRSNCHGYRYGYVGNHHASDSDDSMASDASSGPTTTNREHELPCDRVGGYGLGPRSCYVNKTGDIERTERSRRGKEDKSGPKNGVVVITSVQSGTTAGKVRPKKNLFGRRK